MQPTKFVNRRSGASEDRLQTVLLPADEEVINNYLRAPGDDVRTLVDVIPISTKTVLLIYTEYQRVRPA